MKRYFAPDFETVVGRAIAVGLVVVETRHALSLRYGRRYRWQTVHFQVYPKLKFREYDLA